LGVPCVADVDGDGLLEVVFGSNYDMRCVKATNGQSMWQVTADTKVHSTPWIADVDGDGLLEVVFSSSKNLYCVTGSSGQVEWSIETEFPTSPSPWIVDVDNDGKCEILIQAKKHLLCLKGSSGKEKWRKQTGTAILWALSPWVADINRDVYLEILTGSGIHFCCVSAFVKNIIWRHDLQSVGTSSPCVVDINRNGEIEVIVGLGRLLYCLGGNDGRVIWQTSIPYASRERPWIADVDQDGQLEIIIPTPSTHELLCINGIDGKIKWRFKAKDVIRSPWVVDLNSDGRLAVLFGSKDGHLYCLDGKSGKVNLKYYIGRSIETPVWVGDIDGDGKLEILVNTIDEALYCLGVGETPQKSIAGMLAVGEAEGIAVGTGWGRKSILLALQSAKELQPTITKAPAKEAEKPVEVKAEEVEAVLQPTTEFIQVGQHTETDLVKKELVFALKVANITDYTLTRISILITGYPEEYLELVSPNPQQIRLLEPGSSQAPQFRFQWKETRCIQGNIYATINYFDPKGNPKTETLTPLPFKHICIFLDPAELTEQEFNQLLEHLSCEQASTTIEGLQPEQLFSRFQELAHLKRLQVVAAEHRTKRGKFIGTLDLAGFHLYAKKNIVARIIVQGRADGRTTEIMIDGAPKDMAPDLFDELVTTMCEKVREIITEEFHQHREWLEIKFTGLYHAMKALQVPTAVQLEIAETVRQIDGLTHELADAYRSSTAEIAALAQRLDTHTSADDNTFDRMLTILEDLQKKLGTPKSWWAKTKRGFKTARNEGAKATLTWIILNLANIAKKFLLGI
jgi:outer membrane protein assembly factor BamB